mmetsp:Transcript_657/g.1295  ORF Transcript_657/g.1295 Transcript_657/m.1295 type:complete len:575 (-) Transcript_657:80-1804(-)
MSHAKTRRAGLEEDGHCAVAVDIRTEQPPPIVTRKGGRRSSRAHILLPFGALLMLWVLFVYHHFRRSETSQGSDGPNAIASDGAHGAGAAPRSTDKPIDSALVLNETARDSTRALQRAAYIFFQAVGYQVYVDNQFALPTKTKAADFISLLHQYTKVHLMLPGSKCGKVEALAGVQYPSKSAADNWWRHEWPKITREAFDCGLQADHDIGVQETELDMQGKVSPQELQVLGELTKGLPRGPTNVLSEVLPFLSWRVRTGFTDSRMLRVPGMFTLLVRLWIALHSAALDESAREHWNTEQQIKFASEHRKLFLMATKLAPLGNSAYFLGTDPHVFFKIKKESLFDQMMGHQDYHRYDANCHVGWANRPEAPPPENLSPVDPKLHLLPAPEKILAPSLTVALDIDETLLYARTKPPLLRPYLTEFLRGLSDLDVEIVIWTASNREWGSFVVQLFDQQRLVRHTIYRDSSWMSGRSYTKDLRRLGRNMNHTLILENSPSSVWMNKRNAILIPDYFKANPSDEALRKTLEVIKELLNSGLSVPQFISTTLSLHRKCPQQSWSPTDDSGVYYGIGDFTS